MLGYELYEIIQVLSNTFEGCNEWKCQIMPNELVLVNSQQKTFLDELILIFLRRIKLTWYHDTEGNLNFAIFHLHYFLQNSDEVKKLVKQKYVNDFIKQAYEKKEQEYRLVIKTLLLLKKIYGKNITLFYSEHGFSSIEVPGIEDESSNNPLMTNTAALEAGIKKASEILNEYTLEDMAALGNAGDLLGKLSLDSSVIAPIPHFIPKDIKSNINLFSALSSKYQLRVFISKPNIQSLATFFEDYVNGFISQDLAGIVGINNLKTHLDLFEKVVTEVLGEGKQTKWAEVLLSKSLIAYYATLMDKAENRDYLQYRMIEFLLYLENNSKIEILFLDTFDEMNIIRYEITSMPKNALKIDSIDWVMKIKLLVSLDDIIDFISKPTDEINHIRDVKLKIKHDSISRTFWINGVRKSFQKESELYCLTVELYNLAGAAIARSRVLEILKLPPKEGNDEIKNDNNSFIRGKVKELRDKLGLDSELLTNNDGNISLIAEKESI